MRLCREKGMTVVFITHHMDECVGADRLIVMSAGRVVADGSPAEVFSNVELMESEGLSVPESARLIYELKKAGIAIESCCLDTEGCAEIVAAALK